MNGPENRPFSLAEGARIAVGQVVYVDDIQAFGRVDTVIDGECGCCRRYVVERIDDAGWIDADASVVHPASRA